MAHRVSTYLFRHGTWIYNQIVHLQRWQPIILCRHTDNLDAYPVSPVYSLDQVSSTSLAYNKIAHRLIGYYPVFRTVIHNEEASLIHAHFGPEGFVSLQLSRVCRVPLITTFYGYDLSRLPHQENHWQRKYRHLFKQGDAFLVEGPHMKGQLIELGCPPEKVHIQHLGVDLNRMRFKPRELADDGIVRILIAGTFTEKKGLPYAMEAFARVRAVYNHIRLTVVGDARDKPGEQAIKQCLYDLVTDYGIEDDVTFLGSLSHALLIEEFHRHHLFVSPSVQAADGDNEGGAPVTIIEASATGMPILSTAHCDIPEVVIDGKGGYLVEERNVESLEERLSYLVTHPSEWSRMGTAGRHNIEHAYDAAVQAALLEKLYDKLVA